MKAGTESLLKFKQLKRRLQLRYWQVVGVLEALWRVTQVDAPAGNIGKLSNEDIAAALEWDGDPDSLIDTLINTHWIDRDDEFRLIIHDWSDHAPNHLVGAFKRHGKLFADQIARARHGPRDTARHDALATCSGTMPPSQAKPIQANSNHPQTPAVAENSGRASPGLAGGNRKWWSEEDRTLATEALKATGYKRIEELVLERETGNFLASEIVIVCQHYNENKAKFKTPGAIAERLRTGSWPVNGISEKKPKGPNIGVLKRELIKVDNDARNWSDDRIIAEAKKRGMA